jgi:hypothetical protein
MTEGRGTGYQELYYEIIALVNDGVLGNESPPTPNYWHWPIREPERLPEKFQKWIPLGEVRW